ncbi:hypothetical protein PDENDC454_04676 [Paenibacillus dendritiformis C454]|uniref:Uncharacterized protein n=1 Tax=Paenibacillus dendritiformis C454 TaxID=1131935 RepID=H3SBP9_9BACL|nr:hypothetical protein PDENDC454_04676 [Paenibacillus dendritiformis C454]
MGASVEKPLWIQQFCIRKRLFDVSGRHGEDSFCNHAVEQTVKELGKVYILFISFFCGILLIRERLIDKVLVEKLFENHSKKTL